MYSGNIWAWEKWIFLCCPEAILLLKLECTGDEGASNKQHRWNSKQLHKKFWKIKQDPKHPNLCICGWQPALCEDADNKAETHLWYHYGAPK